MKVQLVTPYRVSHLQRYEVTLRDNVTSVDPPYGASEDPSGVDVCVTQDKPGRSKYRELQRRVSSVSVVWNYCVRVYYVYIVNLTV
jgi:hypothetical protein